MPVREWGRAYDCCTAPRSHVGLYEILAIRVGRKLRKQFIEYIMVILTSLASRFDC